MLYWIIISFLVLDYVYEVTLTLLNIKASKLPIPNLLADVYDNKEYERQQKYSQEKRKPSLFSKTVTKIINLAIFGFGGLTIVDEWVRNLTDSPIIWVVLYILFFNIVSAVINLPFNIYDTFVTEQQFGFNRSTPGLFVKDWILENLGSNLITCALLALVVWLYTLIPDFLWIIAWVIIAIFTLFFQFFYSDLIVPLFNKQKTLEYGELRNAIEKFTNKLDFKLKGIYVMDGSKRSSKANAYFTGFGSKKRIVLYDTLIEQLTTDEIVGVLAHEIGHYKHKHIIFMIPISLIQLLVFFYLFNIVVSNVSLAEAAGCTQVSFHVNLMVFMLLISPLTSIIGFVFNRLSRYMEWQADEFARMNGFGLHVSNALKKLTRNVLENLTPHPLVVAMEYNHPTLLDRVTHLTSNRD